MVKNSDILTDHWLGNQQIVPESTSINKTPKRDPRIRRGTLARQQGYIGAEHEAIGFVTALFGISMFFVENPISVIFGVILAVIGVAHVFEE